MEYRDLYPIGQQSFEVLRKGGAYYVDKTEYMWKIVNSQSLYYFLARPRRFGKSLFLSTLKCFFEAKRNLFKGLYIDGKDWDWKEYPVLHLDFNTERYATQSELESILESHFKKWEVSYGIEEIEDTHSGRFKNIIAAAHRKTGRQVVILVDEYDKPLVNNINNDESFEWFRTSLASLYSNFKSSADHIKLVFLTGVSRFSRLSVFSDLNNIRDITFQNEFADVCGISERELHHYFKEGIENMASVYGESYENMTLLLKRNYDGYRFTEAGSEMYNPWSLLNALSSNRISNYWNQTGLPTIVAESLKRVDADLEATFNTLCGQDELVGLDLRSPKPIALMYQTGYLTIKDYDLASDTYTLGIPNNEVRKGVMDILLPYYLDLKGKSTSGMVRELVADVIDGRPESFMKRLETYFAAMPFKLRLHSEHDLRNAIFILISLVGIQVKAELETSDGAIDITIETPEYIYIIELKYNKSAHAAISQIIDKEYGLPFAMDSRRLYLIGANFNSRKRRFDDIAIQ